MDIKLIKQNVQRCIKEARYEVTPLTNHKKVSGVYMLFVNHFSNEFVIPIYVGQTVDLQRRYQDHMKEIMALNRLSHEFYSDYLTELFYDGKYKSCKIFKYMVENNCTLNDLKMVLLKECAESELLSVEEEYIKSFEAEFVGFNQLSSISHANASRFEDLSESESVNRGINELNKIMKRLDFGFTKFNFLYCYGVTNHDSLNNDLLKIKNDISKLLFENSERDIYKLFERAHSEEDGYFHIRHAEKKITVQNFLLPEVEYSQFPLKTFEYELPLPKVKKDEKQLYFVISNTNQSYNNSYYYAEILKIVVNSNEGSKEYYIENQAINQIYYERDYKRSFCFRPSRFNPIHASFSLKFITLTTEYKTGVNDSSFYNEKIWTLSDAINDIIIESEQGTTFRVFSNQSKKIVDECISDLSFIKREKIMNRLDFGIHLSGIKLLLVNTTLFNVHYHKKLLVEEGIIIKRTRSFSKGLELMRKQDFDCVVYCDENNMEAIRDQIRELREIDNDIPVVVFSRKTQIDFENNRYIYIVKAGFGEMDALLNSLIKLNLYSQNANIY